MGIWELRTRTSCEWRTGLIELKSEFWWAFKKDLWKSWWNFDSDWVLKKLHLSYRRRPASVSVQSSKKQKERSCTGHQHGPCKRRANPFFHTRVSCTDRAREEAVQHGSWHEPCSLFGVARVINTGRVPEACALIFGVARGVPSSIRTVLNGCTGLGVGCTGRVRAASSVLHGACNLLLLR